MSICNIPCETVSWLKARRAIIQTDSKVLKSHTNDILNCFGGIERCLTILLQKRDCINTMQAIKLTNILTQINSKTKAKAVNKSENNKPIVEIIQTNFTDIGTECIEHITTFLTIPDFAQSFNNVCATFAIIGIEQTRKTDYFFLNGLDLIIKNKNQCNNDKYINKIGFGGLSLLKQHRIFKDNTFKTLFTQLATITDIPLQNLSIWHYTDRKNKTYRPNIHIELDWNEEKQPCPNTNCQITEDMILTHTIPTLQQYHRPISIHGQVGTLHSFRSRSTDSYAIIQNTNRMFILLDERKISYVPSNYVLNKLKESKRFLIGLKYFDIFTQKLYFVDWIYVMDNITKVEDLAQYIKNDLICKDVYYFRKCKKYLKQIKNYKSNLDVKNDHFMFYEEETPERIQCLSYDKVFDDQFQIFSGDIFVFQLNVDHPYFHNHMIKVELGLNQSQVSAYKTVDSFMQSI